MSHFESLPAWAAIPVALLVLFGAGLTLIGAVGLWRLPSFYDRLHAPTLGTSWGTAGIVLASILMFSVAGGRAVVHESLIAVFIMVTTPVTLMLLGRAALHRDRVEGNVPFQFPRSDEDPHEAKAAQQLAQAEARANIIKAQETSLAAEIAAVAASAPEPFDENTDTPVEPGTAVADMREGDVDAAETPGTEAIADTEDFAEADLPNTISPDSLPLDAPPEAEARSGSPRDLFPKPADPAAAQGPHSVEPLPSDGTEPADQAQTPASSKPELPEY